jgi:hypothetical protein
MASEKTLYDSTWDHNIMIPFVGGNSVVVIKGLDIPFYNIISLPRVSFPGDTDCRLTSFTDLENFVTKAKQEINKTSTKNVEVIIISDKVTKNKIDYFKGSMVGPYECRVHSYEFGDILYPFSELGISGEKRICFYYNSSNCIISLQGSGHKGKDFVSTHNYVRGNWFEETMC